MLPSDCPSMGDLSRGVDALLRTRALGRALAGLPEPGPVRKRTGPAAGGVGAVVGTERQAGASVGGESGERWRLWRGAKRMRGAAVRVKDAHTQEQTHAHTDTRGCAARRCEKNTYFLMQVRTDTHTDTQSHPPPPTHRTRAHAHKRTRASTRTPTHAHSKHTRKCTHVRLPSSLPPCSPLFLPRSPPPTLSLSAPVSPLPGPVRSALLTAPIASKLQ